jgi:hypothetical protein
MGWLNANGIWIGRNRGGGISWSSYWTNLNSEKAFVSDTFDFVNNQWIDQSGNDNHLNILAPYYAHNDAWQLQITNWLTDFGFSTYHDFIYNSSGEQIIFSINATTSSGKFFTLLTDQANNRLRLFDRVVNVSAYSANNSLINGQRYRLLINWIDKDHINIYINESAVASVVSLNQNFAWQATWNRLNIGGLNDAGTYAYSDVGTICETRVMTGTATWANIDSNISAHWYHIFNPAVLRDFDLSGNNRHLTLVGTAPTVKVYYRGTNPCLKNGYQICKHVNDGATYYDDLYLPLLANGTSLVNETVYPFRNADPPAPQTDEWKPIATIAASTTKYNGCDIKFAFPYNAMLATADADLGALFTGTTPNQLDPYSLWDDHLEKHVMFFNKGVTATTTTGYQRWYNKTCDKQLLEISDLVVFKVARTDHVNILKNQYGYDTTPTVIAGATYRMALANDSFKLASTHLTAAKFAGLWDLFYEKDIADAPLKCRYADVEKINGRNIFGNGTDTLWIYKKPLLPSHFKAALNTHLGLTDIENIITTADGINYYDIDYEKYTITKDGAINFNPSATVDTKYDIFDRRNVVGSAKEIWHGDMVLGSAYWTWNLKLGTKKAYQPTVSKYIQAAYSGKLFVRQDWNEKNDIICPYIISFGTPLAGAAKTAMFAFIDFPETVVDPAIVGDGVTDDALAINTAMGTNAAVMLYEKTAKTQTSIAIPSDVELILADSTVLMNNDINLNVVCNADFTGDDNVKLSGYGVSVIDGNGGNQDRTTYLTGNKTLIPILFGTVNNLKVKGFECKDSPFWGVNVQMSDNALIEHIRFNQLGSQSNQDGLNIGFGTRYSIGRYITGKTNDDFIPILNYTDSDYNVNGSRRTEYNYYRNIRWDGYLLTEALGGQLIRLYDNDDLGISNIEWQNIYGYKNITDGANCGGGLSIIIFSDAEILERRSAAGVNFGYVFNNIRGSATRNIRFATGNYSEIDINNFMLDDPNETTAIHIWVTNHILTNVNIQSVITNAPTTVYQADGGTLTNFVHSET